MPSVPAAVLAQGWRGGPPAAQLKRIANSLEDATDTESPGDLSNPG